MSKPNQFKFQGQEEQTDFDLGWYSFKWRNHDPTTGRFFNVDPLAESFYYNSPYAFSENKVTNHVELEGLESYPALDKFKSDVQATIAGASNSFKNSFKNAIQGTGNFFSNLGSKISDALKEGENSQPFGISGYVTDGSGGPGPNTNGEVTDRIDLTGLPALLSGGKKMGGSIPKVTWEGGAATAEKVKKIIGMLEGGDSPESISSSSSPKELELSSKIPVILTDTLPGTRTGTDKTNIGLFKPNLIAPYSRYPGDTIGWVDRDSTQIKKDDQ